LTRRIPWILGIVPLLTLVFTVAVLNPCCVSAAPLVEAVGDSLPVITETETGWILENSRFTCFVTRENGSITSFKVRQNAEELLQAPARFMLGNWDKVTVVGSMVEDTTAGAVLTLTCRNDDRGSVIKMTYILDDNHLVWQLDGKLSEGQQSVWFRFPLQGLDEQWQVFAPHHAAPFSVLGPIPTLQYGTASPETLSLPMLTAFSQAQDIGLTFIVPFESADLSGNSLSFYCNPFSVNTVSVLNEKPWENDGSLYAAMVIVGHEGDFRPGLGWMYEAYNDYFRLSDPGVAGFSSVGGKRDVQTIAGLVDLGLRWRVVNTDGLTGGYGLWIPDFLTNSNKRAINEIREELKILREFGVKSFLYMQSYKCSHLSLVELRWSDSIRGERPEISAGGVTMNDSPGTSWYDHIIEQVHRMLETFPEADGLYWDWAGDTNPELLAEVAGIVADQGKLLVGNNPFWRTWRYLANGLAEVNTRNLGTLQYLGLGHPINYLPVYYDGLPEVPGNEIIAVGKPRNAERDLKACLLTGSFLMFQYEFPYVGDSFELFTRYRPLFDELRLREWVFSANPLRLPPSVEGNIFKTPEGNYLITLVSPEVSYFDPDPAGSEVAVGVNLLDGGKIVEAYQLSVDFGEQIPVAVEQDGSAVNVVLSRYKSASLVKLVVE